MPAAAAVVSPAGQGVQAEAPADVERVPMGQGRQAGAAALGEWSPGAHEAQAEAPLAAA